MTREEPIGRQKKVADHYTVLLIPGPAARARQLRVRHSSVKRAVAGAVVGAAILGAGIVDYLRLRLDAVDVAALRAETAAQAEQMRQVTATVGVAEERLAELRELERKVRVIANLPKTVAERSRGGETKAGGVGGGLDEEATRQPPAPTVDGAETTVGLEPGEAPRLDSALLARLRIRARSLRNAALTREASLTDLVEGLHRRASRLASTPSIWPAEGWVTSRFGRRISPFTGLPHFHAGIDIAAQFGTQVVAPARGRVAFVGRKGPLGRTVEIDHGYRIRTTYGHLGEVRVRPGQEVERGERIGEVGSTGRSTGPHLHYGVDVNGRSVNPLDYVFE